jgi:ABC-type glycerol-3-phosphate transport system permease component
VDSTERRSIRVQYAEAPGGMAGPAQALFYLTLVVLAVFTLTPLVWLACAAFKGQGDMWTFTFLPYGEVPNADGTMRAAQPTLVNFSALFGKWGFGRNLLNSFFLTATSTSIALILASLGGFALAKYQFKGKKVLMAIMLATMMIPGSVLLAPLYELICHMEMMNSYLGILVPGAVGAFGMLLFRQAMLAIPDDLLEAARIDGCSELGIYWRIVMPVVRPMSGAFCLMSFMGGWNSFLWPMIVLQSKGLFTVPIAMSQTLSLTGDMQYGLMMAGTFLGVLPPAILFFILQKEFIAGLTAGAVKG